MAKTGFSNGFANIPTQKYYKYHGLVRECNIEPILPPYLEFPSEEIGGPPIKIYSGTFATSGGYDARHMRTEDKDHYSYLEVRDWPESFWTPLNGGIFRIGQGFSYQWWDTWEIYRSHMFIRNDILVPTDHIIRASLVFRVFDPPRDKDFDIVIQRGIDIIGGVPVYASQPPVVADYNRLLYDGEGGYKNTSEMGSKYSLFEVPLNSLGLSWINKNPNGIMKFCIRSRDDINGIAPLQVNDRREQCQLYSGNMSATYYKSYLSVTLRI